jgi:ubiquitin C-terminal hydrolase
VLKTQQHFIGSFPMFLFLNLAREEWQFGHMEKDFPPITFPVMLDMTPYAFQRRSLCNYQLAAVISHMGDLGESQGHYITFIKVFGRWFRFDDRNVDAVEKSTAVQENFQ